MEDDRTDTVPVGKALPIWDTRTQDERRSADAMASEVGRNVTQEYEQRRTEAPTFTPGGRAANPQFPAEDSTSGLWDGLRGAFGRGRRGQSDAPPADADVSDTPPDPEGPPVSRDDGNVPGPDASGSADTPTDTPADGSDRPDGSTQSDAPPMDIDVAEEERRAGVRERLDRMDEEDRLAAEDMERTETWARRGRYADMVIASVGATTGALASMGRGIDTVREMSDMLLSGRPLSMGSRAILGAVTAGDTLHRGIEAAHRRYGISQDADRKVVERTVRGRMMNDRMRAMVEGDDEAMSDIADILRTNAGGRTLDNLGESDVGNVLLRCAGSRTALMPRFRELQRAREAGTLDAEGTVELNRLRARIGRYTDVERNLRERMRQTGLEESYRTMGANRARYDEGTDEQRMYYDIMAPDTLPDRFSNKVFSDVIDERGIPRDSRRLTALRTALDDRIHTADPDDPNLPVYGEMSDRVLDAMLDRYEDMYGTISTRGREAARRRLESRIRAIGQASGSKVPMDWMTMDESSLSGLSPEEAASVRDLHRRVVSLDNHEHNMDLRRRLAPMMRAEGGEGGFRELGQILNAAMQSDAAARRQGIIRPGEGSFDAIAGLLDLKTRAAAQNLRRGSKTIVSQYGDRVAAGEAPPDITSMSDGDLMNWLYANPVEGVTPDILRRYRDTVARAEDAIGLTDPMRVVSMVRSWDNDPVLVRNGVLRETRELRRALGL